jgi:hypothetical protein
VFVVGRRISEMGARSPFSFFLFSFRGGRGGAGRGGVWGEEAMHAHAYVSKKHNGVILDLHTHAVRSFIVVTLPVWSLCRMHACVDVCLCLCLCVSLFD